VNLFGSIAPGHAAGLRAARFRVVLAVVDTSVAILLLRSPENVPCRNDMHKTYSKKDSIAVLIQKHWQNSKQRTSGYLIWYLKYNCVFQVQTHFY
jgi:hypothetical protein